MRVFHAATHRMRCDCSFVSWNFFSISFHMGLGVIICLLRCALVSTYTINLGILILYALSTYITRLGLPPGSQAGAVLCRFSHSNPARTPQPMTLRDTKRPFW